MTKEITKAFILQEMQDKFGLRELEPETFSFLETVIPVYSIDQHLERWRTSLKTQSVTATGPVAFFTVPDSERWSLALYNVIFMTGAFTIAGVYIDRKSKDSSSATTYLDLTAAQNTSYLNELSKVVILEPGDIIYANVDGYTSTGDLRVIIDYMSEELR